MFKRNKCDLLISSIQIHIKFMLIIIIWVIDLTPLSTTVHLYCVGQFGWWGKPGHTGKTTDMPEVTDELYHIVLYRTVVNHTTLRSRPRPRPSLINYSKQQIFQYTLPKSTKSLY